MVHGDIPPPPGDIPRVTTYEFGVTTVPQKLISVAAPVHSLHGSTHLKNVTDITDLCGLRKWYLLDFNRLTTKDEGIGLWKSAIFGCLDPKAQELFVILYSLYIYPVIS